MEFAISHPKMVRSPKTESKHINGTLGVKCDHRVWPWPWPWPWIFKVKYRICYISANISANISYLSAKNAPIATKQKANISLELKASNVTNGFDLDLWVLKVKYGICYISAESGPFATKRKAFISIELKASIMTNGFDLDHDLDLWILKVKFDLWPQTLPWPWIFMVKFWNSCISEWEGRLTLHKGGGSRSFMTMTVTMVRCMDLPDTADSERDDFSCWHAVDSFSCTFRTTN